MVRQRRYEVAPAVERSVLRKNGMSGAFALLAGNGQMNRFLGGPVASIDDPALPVDLAADFLTLETYKQASAGAHDHIWGAAERKEMAGLTMAEVV